MALSANWVYNTGNAVTYPSGKYEINGQTVSCIQSEMVTGCRLIIVRCRRHYRWRKGKGWNSNWNFSVYNAYGKENPYIIEFKNDPANPTRTIAQQTALFRWVPSITYNFSF
ncbi:hypothetical protein [Chitinophaga pinensis]|uniref:hypothetical protein n=1 Tax=Chitinophaga pinensis TaxID=79329 RepID=UPI001C997F4C|nr:hypothetical protein [Chitinophaga pinensis]